MGTSAAPAGSNKEDRIELTRLVEEQAALRRVATLVASGAASADVFEAVTREVAQVLGLRNAAVCCYDDDGAAMTVLAAHGQPPGSFDPGSRYPLDGPSVSAEVLRTGRVATFEDDTELPGAVAAVARQHGFSRVVGAPIIVDGRVWGVMLTSSTPDAPLPDGLGDRIAAFTELVATAIGNSQAHEGLARLAEEQAALRRVATLVAEGVAPDALFEAVSAEVARLVPAEGAALTRFEDDGTVTALGGWTSSGGYVHAGKRFDVHGTVSGRVLETGGPARIGDYTVEPGEAPQTAHEMGWHSSVGAPITIEGRLWGVLAVVSREQPLPADAERRLAGFAELVATAVANAESSAERARLAAEQAALRRVATLVAEGAAPNEVFAAVRDEAAEMLGVPLTILLRYDGREATVLATSDSRAFGPVGTRWPLEGKGVSVLVHRTGRAARIDATQASGASRSAGVRWTVGVPIEVEGRLWGVMAAGSREVEPLPSNAEVRLAKFTQLLATAIANAENRAELDASRARIVTTADATRRRIERDLHDGAQQQLVSLALQLRAVQATVPEEFEQHRSELSQVVEGLVGVLDDLREIALGIHPAALSEGGLVPAVKTLARRSPIPVEVDIRLDARLPEAIEVTAYYVVSEALTNAAKHARASRVEVAAAVDGDVLRISVRDDGRGGADPRGGSGLVGLRDRVEAIRGTMRLTSPAGGGTLLSATLPLDDGLR